MRRSSSWLAIILLTLLAFKGALPAVETEDYQLGYKDGAAAAKGNAAWILGGVAAVSLPGAVCLAAPEAVLPLGVVALFGTIVPPGSLSRPNVSAAALMGKSSDYARGYSEGLATKTAQKNTLYACSGGAGAGVVFGTQYFIDAAIRAWNQSWTDFHAANTCTGVF